MEGQTLLFWLKFDVVTPCKVLFNPSGLDRLALYNTHLAITPFDEIFSFFLELFIFGDDVCFCGVPRIIFLMYGCCEPLVCLLEKNLV